MFERNSKEKEMKYDFTTIMERRGHDAIAVDAPGKLSWGPKAPEKGFSLIPMWVADMNFPTMPGVIEALQDRISHPAFGYFTPREEYFSSIIRWHQDRNGVSGLKPEHIGYENGVLGGVVSALNVLCSRGDNVLVHSPAYIGFTNTLANNGYHIVFSSLRQDENKIWRMDLKDMEEKIRNHQIHVSIFCSPHNPCGRVWERWELEAAMELFRKYDVTVISDEIWSDIIMPGYRHIPLQSVSEDARNRTAALYAPSKTFNLAGLVGSYHIIYNRKLRERIEKASSLCHYNEMNVLSMHALIGAYSEEGREWVDELCRVLEENIDYACGFIREEFRGVQVFRPQGTYMLFLDCSGWCAEHGKTLQELEDACWRVGVAVQDGAMFHGPCHLRMNLALPESLVREAMERLKEYVFCACA